MKEEKNIEKILLNDETYEKFVNKKTENEFLKSIENIKTTQETITDIKKVPKEKLFTKSALFSVINKSSKTKSYINGIQAEGYLGAQSEIRKKLLDGNTDSFVSGENYIKFFKLKV